MLDLTLPFQQQPLKPMRQRLGVKARLNLRGGARPAVLTRISPTIRGSRGAGIRGVGIRGARGRGVVRGATLTRSGGQWKRGGGTVIQYTRGGRGRGTRGEPCLPDVLMLVVFNSFNIFIVLVVLS